MRDQPSCAWLNVLSKCNSGKILNIGGMSVNLQSAWKTLSHSRIAFGLAVSKKLSVKMSEMSLKTPKMKITQLVQKKISVSNVPRNTKSERKGPKMLEETSLN